MKLLVLIAVLAVAYLVWRNGRIDRKQQTPPPAPGPAQPQEMVSCCVCALHLPRAEAKLGPDGRPYCSQEHLLRGGS